MFAVQLLRKRRLSIAAVLLLFAGCSWFWTYVRSSEMQVRLGFWRSPVVERTVPIFADPVRAVGGSRDGAVLIAAMRLFRNTEDHPDWRGPDSIVRIVECTYTSELKHRFVQGLVEDVDVSSQKEPHFLISHHWALVGRVPRDGDRLSGGFRTHRAAFSADERQVAFAGGWYTHPGCTFGASASGLLLLERQRGTGPASAVDTEFDFGRGTHDLDREMGIASFAFSPDGDFLCGAGIDGPWAQQLRGIHFSKSECVPMLKCWKLPSLDLVWQKQFEPKRPGGTGIWEDPLPAFSRFTSDGRTLVVGWGRHDASLREFPRWEDERTTRKGHLAVEYQSVEFRDPSTGAVLPSMPARQALPPRSFALEVVGVLREEIVAVTSEALWRQSIDGGEWKRFEIPGAGRITVVKTTRDRKHLLVGDSRGTVHVLRWP